MAALAVAGLTAAGCGGGSQDREGGESQNVETLAQAPCPEPVGVATRKPSGPELAAARAGRFHVYGSAVLRLAPPIDWHQDPLDALRFRDTFPKLRFLDPLLWEYEHRGDVGALRQALAIVLDWARANPLGGDDTAPEAWIDKVAGDRVPVISFVTRAAACEGLLSRSDTADLLGSLSDHAEILSEKAAEDRTNHGLFTALGLARLAAYFPFLGRAKGWKEVAEHEFFTTLRGRLAEGVWLEHSTAYQLLVTRAVQHFAADAHSDRAAVILARMKRALAWFVEPDDDLTQFGDSYLLPLPPWALRIAHRQEGLEAFPRAGFAVVRAPGEGESGDGYLAVAADFHNTTHKHADELSFELYDRGHRIVTDTGLYHKDPGAIRDFVLSARAHSVLTVDGGGFPILDPAKAYGSGLVATGKGDGWYAIEGTNPLLGDQGVSHRRLFVYRPGVALIIADRVRSSSTHEYTRHFQLGPDVEIHDAGPSTLALRAPGLEGQLYDAPAPRPAERQEVRGSRDPLAGLTSPQFRVFRPRWTVDLSSRAQDATYVTTFALDPMRIRARALRTGPGFVQLALRPQDGPASRLQIEREGDALNVTATTTATTG